MQDRSPNDSASKRRPRGRNLAFTLIAVAIPFLLLASLEIVLRMTGVGRDREPLFIASPDHPGFRLANPEVIRRFFTDPAAAPPVSIETRFFAAEKSPDTFRIIVQGGSSAAGFPYGLGASLAGMLEQRLRRTFPERNVEVITTALSAVNSYALLDFADEIIAQEPDLVLIYAGHNEYLGVLGVGSALSVSSSRWLTLRYLELSRLRIFQGMAAVYRAISADDFAATDGEPGPRTLMERVAGRGRIPYGSKLFAAGVAQLSANLSDLLERYRAAGVPVMLGTLVSNEADRPPFESIPCMQPPLPEYVGHLEQGRVALQAGDETGAIGSFRAAVSLDQCEAEARYLLGRALLTEGETGPARDSLIEARDRDQLRFRAPTAFNTAISALASEHDVALVDVEGRFLEVTANGTVGADLMLEHVHPNLDGYFLLADAFYDAMREQGLIGDWGNAVPDVVARANVPVSEVDRIFGEYKIASITAGWPFRDPPVSLALPPPANEPERLARQLFDREINWAQANDRLRKRYRAEGNLHEFTRVSMILADAFPFIAQAQYEAGTALIEAGRAAEAVAYLRRACEQGPGVTNHWLAYAHALVLTGRYDSARESLGRALALDPDNATATKALADLDRLGLGDETGAAGNNES